VVFSGDGTLTFGCLPILPEALTEAEAVPEDGVVHELADGPFADDAEQAVSEATTAAVTTIAGTIRRTKALSGSEETRRG
jgi:hypothetical protein